MLFPLLVILPLLLPVSHAETCHSENTIDSNLFAGDGCCVNNKQFNIYASSTEAPESSFNVEVNNVMATMDVTFPLEGNPYYRVDLYVNDSVKDCDTAVLKAEQRELHSQLLYHAHGNSSNCAHNNCTKTGTVTFSRIFSGCYLIQVLPSGLQRSITVKTNHEKLPAWNEFPAMTSDCTPSTNGTYNVEISINRFSMFFKEKLQVDLFLNKENVCAKIKSTGSMVTLDLLTRGHLTCQHEYGVVPSCEVEDHDTVKCTFENVNYREFYVLVEPKHPFICARTYNTWTVFNRPKCCFAHQFDCNRINSIQEPYTPIETDNESIPYIVISCVIGCVIITILFYIALRKYSRKIMPEKFVNAKYLEHTLLPIEEGEDILRPKILLLYAQDCEPFMNMMVTFRKLLTKSGNCEVLDCFDPDLEEYVSASPNEWMCSWASNSNVKIVIVASDCAVEHQKALSTNCALQYFKPLPLNQLFLSGLKEVTCNQKKDYRNTFVVRFDDKDLSYLTPYTRFVLPQHFEELITQLNPHTGTSNMKNLKEFQRLYEDCTELIDYKQNNPQYIREVLAKVE